MASNTVIKGNSKKGVFTGKAQLLKNTKSTSVSQTDAALAADASAAGGHYIAKTGHCGLDYINTARDLKRVVLQAVQVPQPTL